MGEAPSWAPGIDLECARLLMRLPCLGKNQSLVQDKERGEG